MSAQRFPIVNHCTGDRAVLYHDHNGQLARVERKRGATVINRQKFNASLREHNETPIDVPSFIVGLFAGAFAAFTLCALVAFVAWVV